MTVDWRRRYEELRAACIEPVNEGLDRQCSICLMIWERDLPPRHDTDCILADQPPAEPCPGDAPERRGQQP